MTKPADLIIHASRVVTLDPDLPEAQALAVRGGRVVAVGDEAHIAPLAGSQTRVLHLEGRTVVPGLTDAHLHVMGLGEMRRTVDLRGTATLAEAVERVRGAPVSAGGWVTGTGWDQNLWVDRRMPSRADLDQAQPDRPVMLWRVDGHVLWVNSRALAEAGIGPGTPDPAGGLIGRDEEGEPTGLLYDQAARLVTCLVPPPTRAELLDAVAAAAVECARQGLTCVHDMGTDPQMLAIYQELAAAGRLPVRIVVYLDELSPGIDQLIRQGPQGGVQDRVQVVGVKFFLDGALGSHGAALFEPYQDEPTQRGQLLVDDERLAARVRFAVESGLQVAFHAIGDRANRQALSVIGRELGARAVCLRPRIEHAQILCPEELPLFGERGVVACVQPIHCIEDLAWVGGRLRPPQLAHAYAWRSLLAAGAHLAAGSDAPVSPVSPLEGLWAATTRLDPAGVAWHPDERLTRLQALQAYTVGAAYAAFQEEGRGCLAPGYLADLTVLSEDPLRVPAERLRSIRPVLTMVGGEVVYAG